MRLLLTHCCILILWLSASTGPVRSEEKKEDDPSLLTLERVFSNEFDAKSPGGVRWLKDGSGYTVLEKADEDARGRSIIRCDPETGRRTVLIHDWRLVPPGKSSPLSVSGHAWSADRSKLLVFANTRRVWRRNTRGDYWVLDLSNWDLRRLGGDAEEATLMFAKFSPDGSRVAYVCRNNLYVQNLSDDKISPLTTDGSETIINGTADWVYEEEFGVRDGFRWSPDGKSIAYWQFDSQGVGEFNLINNTDSLYPKLTPIKYPKVGQTNSACRVGVVGADGGKTVWLRPSADLRNNYIPRMQWAPDSQSVVLQQLNRLQNTLQVMVADPRTGRVQTAFTDHDDAWIDVEGDLQWLDEGAAFTWLSERDGWRHLYRVSFGNGEATLLTPGEFDVMGVESIDEKAGWVYYSASPENPTQRYLYRVKLDGSGLCERVTPDDRPGTHGYQISADSAWAVHTYSTINTPPVTELLRLPSHQTVRVLEDNSELHQKLAQLKRRPIEMFRIEIGDGVLLDGWCMKPPQFDPKKQYPLFYYVYGEPAGQTALDRWGGRNTMWHTMLAQQGYIVANLDNRGTPAPRGRAWRKSVYRQIGILASADQAAATRAILEQWPYVDPQRIGIWGASGGGSMSLNAIFRYPDLYSTAMALSFISNQRLYDTIYQERYMGLPEDNEEGYTNGSPITYAHQLKGNLLIVHGTGDDNCHFQSCEMLVNELIEHNKQFTVMFYPNRTHSLGGGNTRRHLYELLTSYLNEKMPPGPKRPGKRDR